MTDHEALLSHLKDAVARGDAVEAVCSLNKDGNWIANAHMGPGAQNLPIGKFRVYIVRVQPSPETIRHGIG